MRAASLGLSVTLVLILACGGDPADGPSPAPPESPAPGGQEGAPESAGGAPAADAPPLVVFLGDSLTAGYGLDEDQAFPARIAERLEEEGVEARIVNAGVSGDTTAGGLARLDWLLSQRPDVVVAGLGANDGLRGLDLAASEANLREIVTRCQAAGARVLLLGMLIPPNYGPDYTTSFRELYPALADELGVPLVPFLLEGVAADPDLNLPDGIHPNAEGQKRVAENVLPHLLRILEALQPS